MIETQARTAIVRCLIVAALAIIASSGTACRQHGTMSPTSSNYQVPRDPSEASARRRLMPGVRSGLTSDSRKVEQSLGY
ncbi:MAG TPA: hypothetical protein VGN12_06130 [Pirellulales bacterium]|jgi:hypothetical protein